MFKTEKTTEKEDDTPVDTTDPESLKKQGTRLLERRSSRKLLITIPRRSTLPLRNLATFTSLTELLLICKWVS